ncbi:hypothetical protein [Aureimonas phyllosphaerae]|uniref:Uncharacterized protein n=1 Tax=Aureimonas phyllosphaerae TaxID=1166078 RepID=A0A7W6C1F9_9HYPH|nr:hypothetical protein [Aureimonas phyllosphaerae]MBB3937676.1 hypothetical protein [Aureimonas phyllosphaerae]MBB3961789.1 hypothetical protein [Aureimonas phyllosphaerae]SFF44977.1 hypothetical protein SAMN05216566_11415 [Aureimonas phyllosphaerae]
MKLAAFNRQVAVFTSDLKSPAARSARLAQVAEEGIADIRQSNRALTGADPMPRVYVDGREGAPLTSVRPDGVIVANFDPVRGALEWIGEQLVLESPRLTGKYQRSHVLEIDGVAWDAIGPMPDGERYVFRNTQPYARKIEPRERTIAERAFFGDRRKFRKHKKTDVGQSYQAPDGVYAAVAAVAQTRFGEVAKILYTLNNYDAVTGYSHPAIIVWPY